MQGRFYEYKKLSKYPRMKPEDVAVWERFIENNPDYFDNVEYDVEIGAGAPQNPELPENIQADGKILTQKKIDVVGYRDDVVYVIELKPTADMRCLGQMLTYPTLYKATYSPIAEVKSMVICREVERELDALFAEHDIEIKIA
ncbi:MAG: hypothetical protein NUV61_02905 [Candidatus Azambacteria bacterium]|nr:hypothetical protein [Candidatus Azambacteria bacterium]